MKRSLLPPTSTRLERDLEQSTARLGSVSFRLFDNWNPQTCPLKLLPWLAWAVGVEEWDSTWPELVQRNVVASARAIRQLKGTPAAIKLALNALSHPNAVLIERSGINEDGSNWATFIIILTRPVSIQQARLIKQRIENVKRVCCHLVVLDFTSTAIKYNSTIKYDGTYSHGMV
jgi:phage tail P2-like protein